MRLTKENKAKIKKRITTGAAALFRERGFEHVNLDHVMESAGLTRGAFYAHFKSKHDLLQEVARTEHPVLRLLEQREATSPEGLRDEMLAIFRQYLAFENLQNIFDGCTVASLTNEFSRSPANVKQAFGEAWLDIRDEMARGQHLKRPDLIGAALVLASGAVATASATDDPDHQKQILSSAWAGFQMLLSQAIGNSERGENER